MNSILVVDDDVHIGNMLEEALTKSGYKVLRAYSGTEVLYVISENKPDLILLDLMLPGLNGEDLLPRLEGIPVIIVSAKIDINNKVDLLMKGAVDYITKPFEIKELLARIAVALRNKIVDTSADILEYKEICMDTIAHNLTVCGTMVKLTKTEYAILRQLMRYPKQVVTKSRMLDLISMETPDCVESSLKVHISNLRKKLRDVSGNDYIEAVWGIGFKLYNDE